MVMPGGNLDNVFPGLHVALSVGIVPGRQHLPPGLQTQGVVVSGGHRLDIFPPFHLALAVFVPSNCHYPTVPAQAHGMAAPGGQAGRPAGLPIRGVRLRRRRLSLRHWRRGRRRALLRRFDRCEQAGQGLAELGRGGIPVLRRMGASPANHRPKLAISGLGGRQGLPVHPPTQGLPLLFPAHRLRNVRQKRSPAVIQEPVHGQAQAVHVRRLIRLRPLRHLRRQEAGILPTGGDGLPNPWPAQEKQAAGMPADT